VALVSVRLDTKTERALDRLAKTTGRTRSELIRQAVAVLEKESALPVPSAYEALSDLLGCARGGPADLSTRTGDRFRQLLRERLRP
jgi:hypothetical protein